jgi:hypothetical protein
MTKRLLAVMIAWLPVSPDQKAKQRVSEGEKK